MKIIAKEGRKTDDKTSKNYLKEGTKFENLNEKFEILSQIPQRQQ